MIVMMINMITMIVLMMMMLVLSADDDDDERDHGDDSIFPKKWIFKFLGTTLSRNALCWLQGRRKGFIINYLFTIIGIKNKNGCDELLMCRTHAKGTVGGL